MATKKAALVVSGGGCKGAFAVGAAEYMIRERGLSFDLGVGTSTGSLVVPLALSGNIDVAKRIYSTVTTDDIVRKRCLPIALLFGDSIYSVSPLHRLIERNFTEAIWGELSRGKAECFATTTCLQTATNVYFGVGGGEESVARREYVRFITSRQEYIRAMLASACQPIFMPPIQVDPLARPVRQYMDGGVMNVTPVQCAIDHGATDIYVVDLDSVEGPPVETNYRTLMQIFGRGLALMTGAIDAADVTSAQVSQQAVDYLRAVKANVAKELGLPVAEVERLFAVGENPYAEDKLRRLTLIRPKAPLPVDNDLQFEPTLMRQMMKQGWDRAAEIFARPVDDRLPR